MRLVVYTYRLRNGCYCFPLRGEAEGRAVVLLLARGVAHNSQGRLRIAHHFNELAYRVVYSRFRYPKPHAHTHGGDMWRGDVVFLGERLGIERCEVV